MIGGRVGNTSTSRTVVCVGLAIQRDAFWLEQGPIASPPPEPRLPLADAIRRYCLAAADRKALAPIVRALARQMSRLADELDG